MPDDFTVEQMDPRALSPNPLNWRRHPESQRAALRASLSEFGFVAGPIWNRQTGNLVDGHARVEEAIAAGRETIPVNVVSLPSESERRLLRMFDPITGMAEIDDGALDLLIAEIGDESLERLLGGVEMPDFQPVGEDEQGRLDEKARVTCPDCGCEFAP
jgi:hypothetical protein